MLRNVKLGKKVVCGFLLVALIALTIGILGIVRLRQIDRAMTEMYEIKTAPLLRLAEAAKIFELNRYLGLQEVDADPSRRAQIESQMAGNIRLLGNMYERSMEKLCALRKRGAGSTISCGLGRSIRNPEITPSDWCRRGSFDEGREDTIPPRPTPWATSTKRRSKP